MASATAHSRVPTLFLFCSILLVPIRSSNSLSNVVMRGMKYHAIETGNPTPHPSSTLAPDIASHDEPLLRFGFLFPLISASAIMWALHRNKQLCCSQDTSNDETIPSEIIIDGKEAKMEVHTTKEAQELLSVVGGRANASIRNDPVVGSSMLNESDWTEESDAPQDTSFSWMENSSAAKYQYLND